MVPKTSLEAAYMAADAAVRSDRKDAAACIGRFWDQMLEVLDPHGPVDRRTMNNRAYGIEDLREGLEQSVGACALFTKLALTVGEIGTDESVKELHRGFGRLAERYFFPTRLGNARTQYLFDFWYFIGHELMVTLFAPLIRRERWGIVQELLETEFFVENPTEQKPGMKSYEYFSHCVQFFVDADGRKFDDGRVTHPETLHKRHSEGELGELLPYQDFAEADFLLGLRSAFAGHYAEGHWPNPTWYPWGTRYLRHAPKYLFASQRKDYAEKLLGVLGVSSTDEFREKLMTHRLYTNKLFGGIHYHSPMREFDPVTIATR
jgi:hypothetical protein